MVFSSLVFLGVFFASVLLLYNLSKNITYKNIILVIASLIFYAWGEPMWVLALAFTGTSDYILGRIIGKYFGKPQAKAALCASVIIDVGILAVFKYSGFIVENINLITGGGLKIPVFGLPIGISFYTFQTLSYTIDTYRGKTEAQKSWISYMAYLSMFPQLVAGPIVRYVDVAKEIKSRSVTIEGFAYGAKRFVIGLGKKVLLANMAGDVAKLLFAEKALSSIAVGSAWLGLLMYTFQIYFDFAGYSDMAIGMGKMLGFNFPENFIYPYISRSATEFWRRWHISLGSFFRDYVYIPLGGNRKRHIRNILVVWLLTGLWHGASWNFILWGLYYGIILLIEKKCFGGKLLNLNKVVGTIYCFILVMLGWGLFYFTDFGQLGIFFSHLFGFNAKLYDLMTVSAFTNNLWLIIACVIASTPLPKIAYNKTIGKSKVADAVCSGILMIAVFALCYIMLVGSTYNPFLYFRF